jgi:SAM-dependent methyltransferase
MSFPHDDQAWAETAEFLRARLAPPDRLVAPDPFRWVIPRAQRFLAARANEPRAFEWIVTHKGDLAAIPRAFLDVLPSQAVPVFANAVFVVWATAPAADLPDITDSDHVRAFHVFAEALPIEAPPPAEEAPTLITATPAERRAAPAAGPMASPLAPARPWLDSGQPGTARERAFQEELDRLVEDYLAPAQGHSVLDIGCGAGRFSALGAAANLTGVDLDEAALARARARHAQLTQAAFRRMDAQALDFAEASFDAVMMIDMAEALADLPGALAQAARVLARGGRLMITAPNRDSLPLRALRRLGQPAPARSLTAAELTGMLRAVGLTVIRSDGIFLSPGWALPGAASTLAPLEEDPEFVEAARILGRRAGPDYALAFCLLARKG